ncbi:hypothetical protein N5925_12040, partial [Glaesserella parasuis]|nr:hypothetical protein [Glaesserella parasuis]
MAKDNDFFESRKYASEANTYNQQQGDKFIERNLQSGVIRSAKDGFEDKVSNVYEKVKEAPSETGKAVAENIWMSVKECGKAPIDCVADVVSNMLMTGKSAVSETYHNIKGTEQADVSTLYGKDVSDEMLMVSGLQLTGSVTEILGAGKVAKVGGKAVVDGVGTIVEKGLKSIDLQNLSKGATLKLPDGKYTYLGDGVFEGPDKGKIINTGKVDPATGNSIYQRINPNGSFSSSFLMISDDGMQISNVNKPDGLFNINNQNRPTPQQSEKYVGQMLPKVAHAQISYKNGKEVPYGTEGSVRPDWCIGEICSIEVKNYNIHSNRANLI